MTDCHLSLLFLFIDAIGKNGIKQCNVVTRHRMFISNLSDKKTHIFFYSFFLFSFVLTDIVYPAGSRWLCHIMNNQSFTCHWFFRIFSSIFEILFYFRSTMNPPKPSKDKEPPGASSSSQVTFVSSMTQTNTTFFLIFICIGWY